MPKIKDLGIKVIPETMRPPEAGGGAGCGAHTLQCGCTNITNPCLGCTANVTLQPCALHTINPCGHFTYCICSFHSPCLCTHLGSIPCGAFTGCGAISPVCGISMDPTIVQQPGELTREHIAALKEQLQQQIAALDEHAKTIGPRTAAAIDARERQLNEELAELKARRKDLGKK